MAEVDDGTREERELLLSSSEDAVPHNGNSSTVARPSEVSDAALSGWQPPEPHVHFHSLSVNLRCAREAEFRRGSARIIEIDRGGPIDFQSIDVDFVWTPRGSAVPRALASGATSNAPTAMENNASTDLTQLDSSTTPLLGAESENETPPAATAEPASDKSSVDARLSLDDFLTIRVKDDPGTIPTVAIQCRGGAHWGTLEFVNGPDVLRAFLKALSRNSKRYHVPDTFLPGALFCVETAPRMRRADRSLSELSESADELGAATGGANVGRPPLRRGGSLGLQDKGISVLEHFVRVTQVTRDLGENLSVVFNDRKRREVLERRAREERARRRAMDINAEIVASSQDERHLPPRLTLERSRGIAVTRAVWEAAMDDEGRLVDPTSMRQAIFSGGVQPDLRADVWPILLGLFAWDSSWAEREQILARKESEFAEMRREWEAVRDKARVAEAMSMAEGGARLSREERVGAKLAEYLHSEEQIEKDILRTDRAVELYATEDGEGLSEASRMMGDILNIYSEYDKKIRYCQGMSDFLSPILYNIGMNRQALVFWCFEGLMQRCECNFRVDQSGIHKQLGRLRKLVKKAEPGLAMFFKETDAEFYTCFRWILVRLKRELSYHATARLWEVLWTRHVGGDDLHLYVAVGLLSAHKNGIMSLASGEFDCLLRYINDMSGRIDVDFALREAEIWFRKLGPIE